MSLKREPWCVLDGSVEPAVMRCKHCHTEQLAQLPMDMNMLAGVGKEFMESHGLCHLSLHALRVLALRLDGESKAMWPSGKCYDQLRAERYLVEATIRRKEKDTNKWPR